MHSDQSRPISIVAGCCNDRLLADLRSSLEGAGTYGCESCHLGLIIAGYRRQNDNKSLRHKEIGQNNKKIRGWPGVGPLLHSAFSAVCEGNCTSWMHRFALKAGPFGPRKRRNGASSFPSAELVTITYGGNDHSPDVESEEHHVST